MCFGHSFTVFGAENANFWEWASKCKCIKTIPLSSLCKLRKCKLVKMVMSCAYVLHVQSIGAKCFFLFAAFTPCRNRIYVERHLTKLENCICDEHRSWYSSLSPLKVSWVKQLYILTKHMQVIQPVLQNTEIVLCITLITVISRWQHVTFYLELSHYQWLNST